MLSTIEAVNSVVNNFIWGVPAMICIIGVGPDALPADPQVPLFHEGDTGTKKKPPMEP